MTMKKAFVVLLTLFYHVGFAQCSMCRAIASSNAESGSGIVDGLNSGILYLMFIPYLLIGIFGWFWYRQRKAVS